MKKEIAYIGLDKMGANMVLRLLEHSWKVFAYNRTFSKTEEVMKHGAVGAKTIKEMLELMPTSPKVVWLMVSHKAVDEVLTELVPLLNKGDLVIDGGNSPYKETIRRAKELKDKGIEFLDIGVSGGPGGARNGACMMVGGEEILYNRFKSSGFFNDTCVSNGYGYMGPSGSGHFVKMVHNGIEYGMMQAIAEGFDLLRHSKDFNFDLLKVIDVYSHGSVITSSLVSWMSDGYKKYGPDLKEISGKASASGEGKWTVEAGEREGIPMPVIKASLEVRESSQNKPTYQGKVVSTMRGEFGHHKVERGEDEPEIL